MTGLSGMFTEFGYIYGVPLGATQDKVYKWTQIGLD